MSLHQCQHLAHRHEYGWSVASAKFSPTSARRLSFICCRERLWTVIPFSSFRRRTAPTRPGQTTPRLGRRPPQDGSSGKLGRNTSPRYGCRRPRSAVPRSNLVAMLLRTRWRLSFLLLLVPAEVREPPQGKQRTRLIPGWGCMPPVFVPLTVELLQVRTP